MVLRACYAMCGTELAYGGLDCSSTLRPGSCRCPSSLRVCYAMPGTGIAYGATHLLCNVRYRVLRTTHCPVLS
eukprot:679299-Rhodomonas_salina.3